MEFLIQTAIYTWENVLSLLSIVSNFKPSRAEFILKIYSLDSISDVEPGHQVFTTASYWRRHPSARPHFEVFISDIVYSLARTFCVKCGCAISICNCSIANAKRILQFIKTKCIIIYNLLRAFVYNGIVVYFILCTWN